MSPNFNVGSERKKIILLKTKEILIKIKLIVYRIKLLENYVFIVFSFSNHVVNIYKDTFNFLIGYLQQLIGNKIILFFLAIFPAS